MSDDISFQPPRHAHIGIDEAGRGCLAGPVVAGAVLAPAGYDFAAWLPGLTDSKALSEKKRGVLRLAIMRSDLYWAVGFSWPGEIDRVNILNATFRAMSRAVCALLEGLRRKAPEQCARLLDDPQYGLFIDGSQSILLPQWQAAQAAPLARYHGTAAIAPGRERWKLPRQRTVVKGDLLVPSISAASIMAKTQRDLLMLALERRYPGYGFAGHKGYGTREHMRAVRELGECAMHRKTFCKGGSGKPAADQFSLLG